MCLVVSAPKRPRNEPILPEWSVTNIIIRPNWPKKLDLRMENNAAPLVRNTMHVIDIKESRDANEDSG